MKLGNTLDANNNRVTNLAAPTSSNDAANKAYVDASTAGLSWKEAVRAASAANLTLSGAQTIDGVSLAAGDRVLVKNQTTASQNGIYVVSAGAWSLASDFSTSAQMLGAAVFVEGGTANADTMWVCSNTTAITVGTTSVTFVQFQAGVTYTASTGINIAGSVISIDTSVVSRHASATIGDGASTSITVNHGLGSQDVTVSLKEVATNKNWIPDWTVVDNNNISLTFGAAPTTGQLRVTVTA
jgi:hypothetical protein